METNPNYRNDFKFKNSKYPIMLDAGSNSSNHSAGPDNGGVPTHVGKIPGGLNQGSDEAKNPKFTPGDYLNMFSGVAKSAYYINQSKKPVADARFNAGFDIAKQQINSQQFSDRASQNERIRNRNAYLGAMQQNSPNAGASASNMQAIFASDDANTAKLSQQRTMFNNQKKSAIADLAVKQGIDRQQQMAYRDANIAERDRFKHTGVNLGLDQIAETGNTMNHYKSVKDTMSILGDMPSNFKYDPNVLAQIAMTFQRNRNKD